MNNREGLKMDFWNDIEFINTAEADIDYSERAIAEFERGMGDRVDEYIARFQSDCALDQLTAYDIGGLVVYTQKGSVRAVYDYENFRGWLV